MSKRLLVVGSINLDLVASSKRIPLPGETVSGNTFNTFPGGKGANQAVAAGRLGAPVSMIGRIGNDAFGTQLRASLEVRGCRYKSGRSCADFIRHRADHHRGGRTKRDRRRARSERRTLAARTGKTSPADSRSRNHSGAARNPAGDDRILATIVRREKIPLMLDPAPARALPASLLASVEWLTPNETETLTLLQRNATELGQQRAPRRSRAATPEARLPQRAAQTRRTRLLHRARRAANERSSPHTT